MCCSDGEYTVYSLFASANALYSTHSAFGISAVCKLERDTTPSMFLNASAGTQHSSPRSTDTRELQSQKAYSPRVFNFGSDMLDRLMQPEKASSPTALTFVKQALFKLLQLWKALGQTLVVFGSTISSKSESSSTDAKLWMPYSEVL